MKPPIVAICRVDGYISSSCPVSCAASSSREMRRPGLDAGMAVCDFDHTAQAGQIHDHAALERHALAVIACAATSERQRHLVPRDPVMPRA